MSKSHGGFEVAVAPEGQLTQSLETQKQRATLALEKALDKTNSNQPDIWYWMRFGFSWVAGGAGNNPFFEFTASGNAFTGIASDFLSLPFRGLTLKKLRSVMIYANSTSNSPVYHRIIFYLPAPPIVLPNPTLQSTPTSTAAVTVTPLVTGSPSIIVRSPIENQLMETPDLNFTQTGFALQVAPMREIALPTGPGIFSYTPGEVLQLQLDLGFRVDEI